MTAEPRDSQRWKNRVALVTGASSGIGARIAVALANAGVIVVGVARRVELIDALNAEVRGNGKIYSHRCDMSDERSICEMFEWLHKKFQTLHILVSNAGVIQASFISKIEASEVRELFDLNVVGTTICLREALKLMKLNGTKGHIVVINSVLGHRIPEVSIPAFSVYPATKHAITALCQTIRQEIHFFKLNIKLTSINPGIVKTDLLKVYSHAIDEQPKLESDDIAQAVMYALETPCNVQVEDITLQAMRPHNAE